MRVFMLGWEFPPFISGGLGTACYGLTKALSGIGINVIFVMPRPVSTPFSTHVNVVGNSSPGSAPANSNSSSSASASANPAIPGLEFHLDEFEHVTFRSVISHIADPYLTFEEFQHQEVLRERVRLLRARTMEFGESGAAVDGHSTDHAGGGAESVPAGNVTSQYGNDLFAEVARYAELATEISRREVFDVVHAHDWMTFPAGMAVAAARGVPLVVHVHSTEYDRGGANIDSRIYDIERRGMQAAMKVIAVSFLTKNQITHHYGIRPSKVDVIYNAVEVTDHSFDPETYRIQTGEKIVLFLGRITHQKGPEYFLAAAKKVLAVMDNVKFVMAGSGDLTRRTIEMATEMGIGHKILFTGFLRGGDVDRVFKMADLYVMPSVSEPFGIAPLEAMSHDVPVLISKQSGVSEVLRHALKVDFWDTTEMANKIIAVLKYPPLASTLREQGNFEVRQLNWSDAANACVDMYDEALGMVEC